MIAPYETIARLPKTALVLAFDERMFDQGLQAVESIKTHCQLDYDICITAIALDADQTKQLARQGVNLFSEYQKLETFADAPIYAYAMTCRPWLPAIFPGYELYMWIDSDIRFCDPDAFHFYLRYANANRSAVVISREIDSSYGFLRYPDTASNYFGKRLARLARTYGDEIANQLQYMIPFNAGIFAMHKDSPIWASYARNMQLALRGPFDHLAEQDALNVAIYQHNMNAVTAPTTMNWLCSNSLPPFNPDSQRYVRPEFPFVPISVLHLTNFFDISPDFGVPFSELYKRQKLTR